MKTVTIVFIILAFFTALFIASFQYLFHKKEKSQINYWLFFYRFLSVLSILILIINPQIEKKKNKIIKPNLIVAVDNSSSIKYNSQDKSVENLINIFKKSKDLNSTFIVNYYSFGNNLEVLDSLNFKEKQTNLSLPFQEFSKLYKTGTNPIILITDGNQTMGNGIEFINYKSPVFPIIVGDTTIFKDISLKRLNVNKFTNINHKFPVELFINYSGKEPILKKINVYHKGKKVYTKQLQFLESETSKIVSFFLTASTKGTQYYTIKIEELDDEQNTLNNVRTFSINVIEEKSEILILTSIIHPDIGMFKKSIERNKQRSVTISKITDFKSDLDDYQLVILYQPTKKFINVFNDITIKKLNYFIVTGLNTDWRFLNKIQSNFHKESIPQSENYYPVFNAGYASFLSNDIGFSDFPPLEDYFGNVVFSFQHNSLLYQKIGGVNTQNPLLATFESNNQRIAILLGENIWRWRMRSYALNNSFEIFDGFISNLIQYLSSNQKRKRLNVLIEPIYYANETIQVSASYLDKNLNFDSRAKLWLTVLNKENNFLKKIPFAVFGSRFTVEFSNIPSGEYNYVVSVENQKSSVSGLFKILPFEIEQQFINANNKELKILANKTKGKVFYNNQGAELVAYLKSDSQFKPIQKIETIKISLIDWKWILGFIVLLLSVEWFTRKYFGMI
ncbi:VWA domain-containing protein [Lutibacter sp.]